MPEEGALMSATTVRRVNIASPEFKHFPDFPDGFRPGIVRVGKMVGAAATRTSGVGYWDGESRASS
jgi:hypothetical protein